MEFFLRRGLFVLWESALGTPALFIFSIIAILYGYLAGASAEEGGVWTSLTCHTSPPPNPWGVPHTYYPDMMIQSQELNCYH